VFFIRYKLRLKKYLSFKHGLIKTPRTSIFAKFIVSNVTADNILLIIDFELVFTQKL